MVYLLHFSIPYPRRSAPSNYNVQHYVGYTTNLRGRMFHHRAGRGSRLVAAVLASGRKVVVARKWLGGDRGLERRIKNFHGSARQLCPICSDRAAYRYFRE